MAVLDQLWNNIQRTVSCIRNLNGTESAFNGNGSKFVKSFTCPVKYEGDIDIEAEEFIKQKLKHLMNDVDNDVKTERFTDRKNVVNKGEDEEVYVDAKAEEFIKKKKSELRKVFINAG